jgi:hypothetical protein
MEDINKLKEGYTYHLSIDAITDLNQSKDKKIWKFIEILFNKKIKKEHDFNKHFRNNIWMYEFYLSQLAKYMNDKNLKINKLLIFEAPPDSGHHFLYNGHNYFSCFHDGSMSTADKQMASNLLHFLIDKPKWFIKKFVIENHWTPEGRKFLDRIQTILDSGIVFSDLLMIPMDFSDLREQWKQSNQQSSNGKGIPVYLLDWCLESLICKLSSSLSRYPLEKNCLIGIGTPINTSISIFEYYVDKLLNINDFNIDISRLNSPTAFKKTNLHGTTFPMFKANVISSGGGPSRALVKNAFNLQP